MSSLTLDDALGFVSARSSKRAALVFEAFPLVWLFEVVLYTHNSEPLLSDYTNTGLDVCYVEPHGP
jgi:hypothetical protein